MEKSSNLDSESIERESGSQFSELQLKSLISIGKWTKYFGVVGVLVITFFAIYILFTTVDSSFLSVLGLVFFGSIIGFYILLFYAFLYLIKYAQYINRGANGSQLALTKAFNYLNKSLELFGVILTILIFLVGIYFLLKY